VGTDWDKVFSILCVNFDQYRLMEIIMNKGVITITDAEFETEVLKAEQPVLVYFWASWCGPCQLMSPLINLAATTYGDRLKIVKIEADPNPLTVKEYRVEGLPALRLLRGETVLESTEGVISKNKLLSFLDQHLNNN
jgi:thioredoxin 1